MTLTYKDAGVDVAKGNAAVHMIGQTVKKTFNDKVLTGIGLFGSLFDVSELKQYTHPVLVQSIDGVGTKMAVAQLTGRYDICGRDIVAHGCNDVLCQGAKPLNFLDYVATAQLDNAVLEKLIQGMADECAEHGVALVGGETAEMPGTYQPGEWDLAGVILGVVEKDQIRTGSQIQTGDVVIGIKSNGLHTNGYSLARKVLFEAQGLTVQDTLPNSTVTLGEALMQPHQNYSKIVLPLLEQYSITGIAHITGGGLIENIPRILPAGLTCTIRKGTWPVLPIFQAIQQWGEVPEHDMYVTFNMGIGLTLMVRPNQAEAVLQMLNRSTTQAYVIGEITPSQAADTKEVCFV